MKSGVGGNSFHMINFYRKIRRKLANENQFIKYSRYAIGEIALVMIGILLALQVNNWNENRKAYTNSKNYLTEVYIDLQDDTTRFNAGIAVLDGLIADEEWVLSTANYTQEDVNRLWDCFSGWYMDYQINDRTYQKIQNEGKSKLIGFETVAEKINYYYTTLKSRTKSFTDWDKKDVTDRHIYLRDLEETIEYSNHRLVDFSAGEVKKTFPMRQDSVTNGELVIAFANSTRGRNHFKNNYVRHIRVRNWFIELVAEATKLLEEVNLELENVN